MGLMCGSKVSNFKKSTDDITSVSAATTKNPKVTQKETKIKREISIRFTFVMPHFKYCSISSIFYFLMT